MEERSNVVQEKIFSILVTTYNHEKYIESCLNSILNQEYNLKKIQLIIIDDKSSDNTRKIIKRWGSDNKNKFFEIKYIFNKKNLGISETHDLGIKKSTGYYFKYIAGDDILNKNAIQNIENIFEKNPSYLWGVSNVKPFKNNLNDKFYSLLPRKNYRKIFNFTPKNQLKCIYLQNYIPAPGTFFKRELFDKIGGIEKNYRTFEDWHTWIRILEKGYKPIYLEETLVFWRRHKESLSFSALNNKNNDYFKDQLNIMKKYILPNKLDIVTKLFVYLKYFILKRMIKNNKKYKMAENIRKKEPLDFYLKLKNFKEVKN
jgi:glycosyltransferase involved in cell wall biosynthesis